MKLQKELPEVLKNNKDFFLIGIIAFSVLVMFILFVKFGPPEDYHKNNLYLFAVLLPLTLSFLAARATIIPSFFIFMKLLKGSKITRIEVGFVLLFLTLILIFYALLFVLDWRYFGDYTAKISTVVIISIVILIKNLIASFRKK